MPCEKGGMKLVLSIPNNASKIESVCDVFSWSNVLMHSENKVSLDSRGIDGPPSDVLAAILIAIAELVSSSFISLPVFVSQAGVIPV